MDPKKFVSVRIPVGKDVATKIKVFHNDEEVLEVDLGEIYVNSRCNSKLADDAKNRVRIDRQANSYKADGETWATTTEKVIFGKTDKAEERLIAQSTLVQETEEEKLSLSSMSLRPLTPTCGKSLSPASSIGTLCESPLLDRQ